MELLNAVVICLLLVTDQGGLSTNHDTSDPLKRMEQLIVVESYSGPMQQEWRIFWFNDQPSHLTYDTVHGGIGP